MTQVIFPEYAKESIEKWLNNLLKSGAEDPSTEEKQLISDWLFSLPEENPKMMNKLYKLNWSSAMSHQKKWHEQMAKRSEKVKQFIGNPNDIKVIKELPNGMKWVEILTPEGKDYEGDAMGHCVGRGNYDNAIIYSLRDKDNLPHCTIQFNKTKKVINQIKGKANNPIIKKYYSIVLDFIEFLNVKEIDDLESIGMIGINKNNKYHIIPIEDFINIQKQENEISPYNIKLIEDNVDIKKIDLISSINSVFLTHIKDDEHNNSLCFKNINNLQTYDSNLKIIKLEHIQGRRCVLTSESNIEEINSLYTSFDSFNLENINANITINGKIEVNYHLSISNTNISSIDNFIVNKETKIHLYHNEKLKYIPQLNVSNLNIYSMNIDGIKDNTTVKSKLLLMDTNLDYIGNNVSGDMLFLRNQETSFSIGDNLKFNVISIKNTMCNSIGNNLSCKDLVLSESSIKSLDNLYVENILHIENENNLTHISNLKTGKNAMILIEKSSEFKEIKLHNEMNNIPINLEIYNCPRFNKIQDNSYIDNLVIESCHELTETGIGLHGSNAIFKNNLGILKISDNTNITNTLNLRNCESLYEIGKNVKVNKLDLSQCYELKSLPDDLQANSIILPNGNEVTLEEAHDFFNENSHQKNYSKSKDTLSL